MRRATSLFLAALLLAATAVARAGEPDDKEQKARAAVAAEVLSFVTWCAENGATEAGETALAEARSLTSDTDEAVTAAESALSAAEGAATDDAITKARRIHGPKVAKAYDKLADQKHDDADTHRFDGYRLTALRWEPSSARVKKAVSWVKGEDDEERAARLLARARAAAGEASGPLDSHAVSAAQKNSPLLIGSTTNDLVGWLWLPKDWKKGKSYAVLIGVDGAGSNHKGYGAASASARGSRDVIVLAPITLSNTNELDTKKYPYYAQSVLDEWNTKRMDFDGPGVDGLLDEIAALFGGTEGLFLTGFSGGGQFTYYKLLTDPGRVLGAVPCCANFAGHGKQGAKGPGESGGPPVLLLTGEDDPHRDFTFGNKDSPGIEPQTDHAMQTLKALGYTHVERRMVKAGHSPLHAEVWKFVDGVLDGK